MPASITQARSLDEWLSLLDGVTLPVSSQQKDLVQFALADSRNSLNKIAAVVSQVPVIALLLFRDANRHKRKLSDPAHSMESVLARLGITRCRTLVARIKAVPEEEISPALRQLWLISRHANSQANALFAPKLARLWQEIHWGSLLFLSPLWPLVSLHPNIFIIWEQRVVGNKEPIHKVEQELFGVSLPQLCLALAEKWALPDWITSGYTDVLHNRRTVARTLRIAKLHLEPIRQQQELDQQTEVARWFRQPANCIVLANGLALAVHNCWGNEHSLRWQRFISMFLGQPLDDVQAAIHHNAVEDARNQGKTRLWHPARALLWPWQQARLQPSPAVKEQKKSASGQLEIKGWQGLARQMLERPSPFRNYTQLLDTFSQMLAACSLPRSLLLGAAHSGYPVVYQRELELELQQTLAGAQQSMLLQKLASQEVRLHINPQNSQRLLPHLPPALQEQLDSQELLLGSIVLGQKTMLLVVADNFSEPINENVVRAFAASCNYLQQALAIMFKKS